MDDGTPPWLGCVGGGPGGAAMLDGRGTGGGGSLRGEETGQRAREPGRGVSGVRRRVRGR